MSFGLGTVGGSHLYPRFILGLSLLAKGPVLGLDVFPHKEESKKIMEGSTPLPYLDNMEGKEPYSLR